VKVKLFLWLTCFIANGMAHPPVADGGDGFRIWRKVANV
jgi:hypothetical protein